MRAIHHALVRAISSGELLPGEIPEQHRQGPIDDLSQIPIWDLVPQQVLRKPQLLTRLCVGRELHFVALWRKRGNDCRAGR